MPTQRLFPSIKPSGRTYSPGEYPQTTFEAQNGAKSVIRYGNKRVNAQLSLSFNNITDAQASDILDNYKEVNSDWDYVVFNQSSGTAGIESNDLANYVKEISSGLRWRYSGPPKVTSVQPGISNVSCSFVGCLDGD
jgi:hypothetical protein